MVALGLLLSRREFLWPDPAADSGGALGFKTLSNTGMIALNAFNLASWVSQWMRLDTRDRDGIA